MEIIVAERCQVTGIVLAGGRGRRMGHVDKGLADFKGNPLALHAAQRLRPQVDQIMINANQNLDRYRAFGMPVCADMMSGFQGPLAGLQTGLMVCTTPYLVTVPCDSPFFPDNFVAQLATQLQAQSAEIAMVVTGTGAATQSHPVFSLLSRTILPQLSDYLMLGGRKMTDWFATCKVTSVHFADDQAFRNINTPDELERYGSDTSDKMNAVG
jgi:molybdopterin-guanine dinucleotide biosynthesis protein A